MEMILIYPVFIGIAIATAELARDKGYKGRWWFLMGLLLPIFSLAILFLLKKRTSTQTNKKHENNVTHSDKILYQKSL
ncbi:MAG: hypothetical protein ACK5XN_19425 [Bacteroidota bacterium]|jgi:hypothetical protein